MKKKELRSEYPQLNIDVTEQKVTLNCETLNLAPPREDISNDVNLFLKYMNGYSKFHGDYTGMQYRYFEFANWFFCSPFMAVMRDMASRFEQNKLPYPVFGLVYGQSKAGKTSFLETLLNMMIGQKPKVSAPDFTRSSIEGLKREVQGAPIIVNIIKENSENVPEYIRELSLEDYFSEHVTGKHAKAAIIGAWRNSPKSFVVQPKTNELRYNAGQTYEAERLIKELPETLEARKSREWITMNLAEAKKFFGVVFKKSILPWKG